MKHFPTILFLIVASHSFASAQDRPRFVQIPENNITVKTNPMPIPAKRPAADVGPRVIVVNQYPPAPAYSAKYRDMVSKAPATEKIIIVGMADRKALVNKIALVTAKAANSSGSRSEAASRLAMRANSSLRGYSTGDDLIDSYIVDSTRRHTVDPLLIVAQMNQESSFKTNARSPKGASGLMQLMPATAKRMGVDDIYDPKQNIEGGVKYMRQLLDMFSGDVSLALAGYNAGENAVIKYNYQIPPYPETQDYVRRISSKYQSIAGTTTARMSTQNISKNYNK
ncbi:hypothetical protein BH10ACI2_BH10ACI2_08280 [soil metagenome]